MHRIFSTDGSWQGLVLRLAVGLVMFPHGAQKLLGWFGGYGYTGTMGFLTGQMGLPAPVAFLVILAESVGAVLLLAGLLTRVWSLLLAATMIGAVATMHWGNGFFMNWFGNQAGEGFEYHVLVVAMTGALAVFGGGRFSADAWIADRLRPAQAEAQPARSSRRQAA